MIHAIALAAATVHIRNFAFSPSRVTVAIGQPLRFVNDDQDAHTVNSATRLFDSGGLDTGESWTHAFAKPGRYPYFCALHPYMRGTIVVVARKTR